MPFEDAKTIADVLRGIQQQDYVLPAIQREIVWDPDTQVVRLFDSLMRGCPIGAFLFLSWSLSLKMFNVGRGHDPGRRTVVLNIN